MSNELSIVGISRELAQDFANPTNLASTNDTRTAWFTAPEAFTIDHSAMPLPPNIKIQDLNNFVGLVESWLTIWLTTGSNSFIHAHLYGNSFPSCLQIAFAMYSAYLIEHQLRARLFFVASMIKQGPWCSNCTKSTAQKTS
jgi:hypothetical protein